MNRYNPNWSRRNNRYQIEQPQKSGLQAFFDPEKTDWTLILILFIFNFYSFYTSYKGAEQVLPDIAFPLALFIQTVLFFTLAGWAVRFSALFRRWFTILIFAFLSIYTSFFFLYDNLTAKATELRGIDQAIKAHTILVNDVMDTLNAKKEDLEQKADNLRKKAEKEEEIGLTTNLIGCGPVCLDFREKALEADTERANFQEEFDRLYELYNYPLDGKSADDIYDKDNYALSQTQKKYLPDKYQSLDLPRDKYIDEESEVDLLAPYYKLTTENSQVKREARTALAAALLADGMAVILGTVVSKKKPESPIKIIGRRLSNLIDDFGEATRRIGEAVVSVFRSSSRQGLVDDLTPQKIDKELERLGKTIRRIYPSASEAYNYLSFFYDKIRSFSSFTIDHNNHYNKSSPFDYRILLDTFLRLDLVHPIKSNGKTSQLWKVKPKSYHQLTSWFIKEIERSKIQERNERDFYSTWGFREEDDDN